MQSCSIRGEPDAPVQDGDELIDVDVDVERQHREGSGSGGLIHDGDTRVRAVIESWGLRWPNDT